jgi:alkylhydroperoxidase family enzyme
VSRIPLVDPDDAGADPEVRELLGRITTMDRDGFLANVLRAWANHPALLRALTETAGVFYSGRLTPVQRELAYLTASFANDCHY